MGDALTAGSIFILFAMRGSMLPTVFAINTVTMREPLTTRASFRFLPCIKYILTPFATARIMLIIAATLNYFHHTLRASAGLISSIARPRIIRARLCAPQLPPVSMSIGMKATRRGTASNAFS